jgi:hypothetical protein
VCIAELPVEYFPKLPGGIQENPQRVPKLEAIV